jgi:hypothetical protein
MNDPKSVSAALDFLRSLGAPPRLIRHSEIVAEVAVQISSGLTRLDVKHDEAFIAVAAALHDAGKIVHREELTGPGRLHESAGEKYLLSHDISPRLARVCRTHGSWNGAHVTLEEHLIALADHIWKGTRGEQIEKLIVEDVAARLCVDGWEALLMLDPELEKIAAAGSERLARARA